MKLPRYCLLLLPLYLLFPLSRWLAHQHVDKFFLGLSSGFWTGVTIGVSIVGAAASVALLVVHLYANKANPSGEAH
jgi:hypothetical protein